MKATLEFDLDDADDKLSHIRCVSATDAFLAMHDVADRLRDIDKYKKKFTIQELRREFYEILESRAISLDYLP